VIESDIYESVRRDGGLYMSKSETPCELGQMLAYGNKRAYCAEGGQHPRLNREHDLWKDEGWGEP